MSAPRPYETDPFHPQSSVRILCYGQFLYIFKTVPHISSMWYLHCVLKYCIFVIYACALFRTPYFKVQRHFEVILSLLTHWQEIQRDIATKTRYKCIIIRRSQHANFASLRKERDETHTDCSMPPSIDQGSSGTFCSNRIFIEYTTSCISYTDYVRKKENGLFPERTTVSRLFKSFSAAASPTVRRNRGVYTGQWSTRPQS